MGVNSDIRFSDLTWDDLSDWAGDRIVGRGKSYKRRVEKGKDPRRRGSWTCEAPDWRNTDE